MEELENELYFNWIDDLGLRSQLSSKVKLSKANREQSQKEVSDTLEISLTKIKEIEKGTCKDFNSINNYINYFSQPLLTVH